MELSAAGYGLFPVVGLAIGAILLALDYLARMVVPSPASSALVVVGLAALTGALHLDGLADTADGLFGGRDRERRLAIMRDPHNGAFGFVAVASALLLKWAALIPLEDQLRTGTLLLAPSLARWSVLPSMILFPAAKGEGMGFAVKSTSRWPQAVLGSAVALALSVGIFWPTGLALPALALVLALAIGAYATSRLGGVTGDVLGCTVEVNEAALLLLAATSVTHPWLS
jgi:adenosylcobinamide-GDP ribazoletransferase